MIQECGWMAGELKMGCVLRSAARFWIRTGIFLILSSAALAYAASGASQPQIAQTSSGSNLSLSGVVVNSLTGQPIAYALVRLASPAGRVMLSKADGTFQFDGLPEGLARLEVHKPGFLNESELNPGSSIHNAQLTVTSNMAAVTLALTPEAIIFGRVEDANGEPLEGAMVQLTSSAVMDGRKTWMQAGSPGRSGEDGEFRIAGLRPGTYYVAVRALGDAARNLSVAQPESTVGYPAVVYYPGVTDVSLASPVQLNAGRRMQLNFSLRAEPAFKISGTVTGQAANRAVFVRVVTQSREGFLAQALSDPQTGKFELKSVVAGSYLLLATLGGGQSETQMTAEVELNVTKNVSGVQLVLGPILDIPVMARSEFVNTEPAKNMATGSSQNNDQYGGYSTTISGSGQRARFTSGSDLALVFLRSGGEPFSSSMRFSGQGLGPVIRNVLPGRYIAEIKATGHAYVASAMCGATNLLKEELIVSRGVGVPPIEIVVRDDGASVQGTVRYSNGEQQSKLLLIADSAPTQSIEAIFIGGDGRFSLANLAPGSYKLLALDRTDNLEYQNPEVLSRYLAHATPVTLDRGGVANVTLDVVKIGE